MGEEPGGRSLRLRTDGIAVREVGGEALVYREATGTYLTLNGIGRELWQQIEEGASEASLAGGLVERFDVDPERARADVAAFLRALAEHDLLAPGPGS